MVFVAVSNLSVSSQRCHTYAEGEINKCYDAHRPRKSQVHENMLDKDGSKILPMDAPSSTMSIPSALFVPNHGGAANTARHSVVSLHGVRGAIWILDWWLPSVGRSDLL